MSPELPAPTALDVAQVARAAAVLGSCFPDDGVPRNAAEIWHGDTASARLYFRFGTQLECLANAECGCDAIEHCLGYAAAPTTSPCTEGCSGDVWTWGCATGTTHVTDCGRLGLSCDDAAGCVPEPTQACDSEPSGCTADGEVRFCDDGFTRTAPCGSLGFACVDGACTGAGAACDGGTSAESEISVPTGTSCEGDTLIGCLRERTTQTNCAERGPGFTCQSVGDTFFCGVADECVPSNVYSDGETPTCDGAILSFCNAGRLEQIDCTALGFTGCDIDSSQAHYGCTPGAVDAGTE